MKQLLERVLSAPFLLTLAACLVLEALILLVLYSHYESLLDSLAFSIIILGPASAWVAPPLYRHLVRAQES